MYNSRGVMFVKSKAHANDQIKFIQEECHICDELLTSSGLIIRTSILNSRKFFFTPTC